MKTIRSKTSLLFFCFLILLSSCSKNPDTVAPTGVDFTLDLTSSEASALKNNGGFMAKNKVLVIRYDAATGKRFYALQQSCTYAGCDLTYLSSDYTIQCPCHGCLFDVTTGTVLQGPAKVPLATYATTLTGNSLRIKSR